MLKFDASIFGGELPVGLGVVGIAVLLPGGDFLDEDLFVGNAAIEVVCTDMKTRFGNSGDEGRRGRAQIRCGPRAGWRDGSERLCRETDESSKPLIVGPRR